MGDDDAVKDEDKDVTGDELTPIIEPEEDVELDDREEFEDPLMEDPLLKSHNKPKKLDGEDDSLDDMADEEDDLLQEDKYDDEDLL